MQAIWNGVVIAESEATIIIEENHYFPPESIAKKFLSASNKQTVCPWKGIASYYNLIVDGKTNNEAAWYYPNPSELALKIKNYLAFWKGVEIIK